MFWQRIFKNYYLRQFMKCQYQSIVFIEVLRVVIRSFRLVLILFTDGAAGRIYVYCVKKTTFLFKLMLLIVIEHNIL